VDRPAPGVFMKIVRVPALTGLRFVAAMMVLIGHGLYAAHFAADTMTSRILEPLPSMGMTLFLVLSGFVMWVNYARSFRERFWSSLWCFGVARFARLAAKHTCAHPNARAG
jgi:peptidoglycan/LPS O-acetylase OafA/YrhL